MDSTLIQSQQTAQTQCKMGSASEMLLGHVCSPWPQSPCCHAPCTAPSRSRKPASVLSAPYLQLGQLIWPARLVLLLLYLLCLVTFDAHQLFSVKSSQCVRVPEVRMVFICHRPFEDAVMESCLGNISALTLLVDSDCCFFVARLLPCTGQWAEINQSHPPMKKHDHHLNKKTDSRFKVESFFFPGI